MRILIRKKSNDINFRSYTSFGYILITIVIGLLNSFCCTNKSIMAVLCALEIILLGICFVLKKNSLYISLYTIFLCMSMESKIFTGTDMFYGFKNFRIFRINLAFLALIPMFLEAIINYRYILHKSGKLLKKILCLTVSLFAVGLFMTLITYLANDNGFSAAPQSLQKMIEAIYSNLVPIIFLITYSWCIISDKDNLYILERCLFSVIIATGFIFIICLITSNYGNRGGFNSLQVSEVYFLLVSSPILLVYNNFKNPTDKVLLSVFAAAILLLSLAFNASGKIVITMVLNLIILLVIAFRSKSTKKILKWSIGIIVLTYVLIFIILPKLLSFSELLSIKFEQATLLFNFGQGWLQNMPDSPRMRIAEFMNICAEYYKKPWYFFPGKGFCGTITDSLNLFENLTTAVFSSWELSLGTYYTMHESINRIFLSSGVFGLCILVKLCGMIYNDLLKSPWLLFGLMWILLFWGYHMTILCYGILALVVGSVIASKNNESQV